MTPADDRGAPAGIAEPKRSYDNVPVRVDWHDYLINRREEGAAVAQNYVFRPPRAQATGLEYKCTTAGVTSAKPFGKITWPAVGLTVTDGSVVWTAQAISASSLRTTISSSQWPSVTGLTLSSSSNSDQIYTTNAAGGNSGERYEIVHEVTLANGELKEGLIILPVQD
jgi:hypothetical protein